MQLYIYNGQPTTYSITKDGKLFNSKTNKWLKGQISKNGYFTYCISFINEKKRLYAHRMVMETFQPNEESKNLEVNHKDGNKLNNNLNNLEWVTSQENKKHAIENNLASACYKKVFCFDKEKQLIAEYKSLNEATKLTGFSTSTLSQACNLEIKILSHGFYWSFESNNTFSIQTTSTGLSKTVGKYNKSNLELIQIYPSIAEAARQNNIGRSHIGECCSNKIKSYAGFIWKFI